jgi:hypothetical protein
MGHFGSLAFVLPRTFPTLPRERPESHCLSRPSQPSTFRARGRRDARRTATVPKPSFVGRRGRYFGRRLHQPAWRKRLPKTCTERRRLRSPVGERRNLPGRGLNALACGPPPPSARCSYSPRDRTTNLDSCRGETDRPSRRSQLEHSNFAPLLPRRLPTAGTIARAGADSSSESGRGYSAGSTRALEPRSRW